MSLGHGQEHASAVHALEGMRIKSLYRDTRFADLIRLQESHAYLHAAPLPVRHLVQAPLQIDLQQVYELLPPLWIHALHPKDHLACRNVPLREKHTPPCWCHAG